MESLLKFLKGKKTFILAILVALVTALSSQGVLNDIWATFCYSTLSILGAGAGIATKAILPKQEEVKQI